VKSSVVEVKNDITLIIITCRAYQDVFDKLLARLALEQEFLKIFSHLVVASDERVCINSDFENQFESCVFAQGLEWAERLRVALDNVRSSRCFLLLDDYIPTGKVNTTYIKNIISKNSGEFDVVYMSSVLDRKRVVDECLMPHYYKISEEAMFRINTAPGVWDTKSLKTLLELADDPWSFEAFVGYTKEASKMKIFTVCEKEYQAYPYSYETGGAVYRGAWVYSALIESGMNAKEINEITTRPVISAINDSKRLLIWKIKFIFSGVKISPIATVKFIVNSYVSR